MRERGDRRNTVSVTENQRCAIWNGRIRGTLSHRGDAGRSEERCRMADSESERGSVGLAALARSSARRSQWACRRRGVVPSDGSGRDRRGLQQRGAGGEA